MDGTTQAARRETWALDAATSRVAGTAAHAPSRHVRDLVLAVSAAVLLGIGGGVVMTGGLMSADRDVPAVVGTAQP